MKKSLFASLLALALVLTSAGVCFADTDEGYFVPVQTLTASSSSFSNALMKCYTAYFGSDSGLAVSTTQDYEGLVVIFRYPNTNANYPDKFCMVSHNYFDYQVLNGEYWGSFSNLVTVPSSSVGNFTVSGDLYYHTAYYNNSYSSITYNPDIMRFTTLADGLAWAESALSSTVGEVIHFSVPAGYALVIDGPCEISDRTFTISNSFDFPAGSTGLVNGSYERTLATPYTNVEGYQVDTPFNLSRMVQWSSTNANWAGVSSNYSYRATDVITLSSGNSYVFSYPQYYAYGPSDKYISYQNAVNLECSVYFEYSGDRPSVRLVAIGSQGALESGYFHYYNVFKPSVYDVTGSVSFDSNGQTLIDFNSTDSDGGVVTPPSGGGNTGQVPLDEGTDLLGTIKRFVNDIKSLLGSAVEGINELVSSGSSFMHSIAGMFEWLPAPLLSIITTAFVVLLVVGVLKTLWR